MRMRAALAATVGDQTGSILLLSLVLVFLMTFTGFALFDLATVESRLVTGNRHDLQAFNVAEGGMNRGYLDLANGDGTRDFAQVFAGPSSQTLFTGQAFSGGSYTVTAAPVPGSVPNRITLTASGCAPAASPCPAQNSIAVVRASVTQAMLLANPIFGNSSIAVRGGGRTDSYDSSQGVYNAATAGRAGSVASNGSVSVRNGFTLNGSLRSTTNVGGSDVTIAGGSIVNGNVVAGGTVSNSGTVNGTITQNSPSPQIAYPPVTACGPPYTPSGAGMTWTGTPPYNYSPATGALQVKGNQTLTLANGNYCFGSITLSKGGTLKVNGPVVIYVTGETNFTAGTVTNSTLRPDNLQILSSCTTAVCGSSGVTLSNGSVLYGVVYAPGVGIVLKGNAELFGALVGDSISIPSGSPSIHYDQGLGKSAPLRAGTPSFSMSAWQRCRDVSCS